MNDAQELELPLLQLFTSLRKTGLSLGIDEYLLLLHALQAGFGLPTRDHLGRLCKTLWIKSPAQERLFDDEFKQLFFPVSTNTTETPRQQAEAETAENILSPSSPPTTSEAPSNDLKDFAPEQPFEMEDEIQIVRAVSQSTPKSDLSNFILSDEYFPIKRRQMKQNWRSLRQPLRTGLPVELDIEATVKEVGRQGLLLQPQLAPQRKNRAELLLLIEQDGAMEPFHALSQRLAETALREGGLGEAAVYYFHGYPTKYVYRDPARLEAVPIHDVLHKLHYERAGALLFSDAGAAYGSFNQERVRKLQEFLTLLKEHVRHMAWLNPMPSSRWLATTAGELTQSIPMFELSLGGLKSPLRVLRGQPVSTLPLEIDPSLLYLGIPGDPVESFTRRYGLPHLYLAQHAAFPLALTPDLLYRLRENFQHDSDNQKLDIPWIAVADLLLSNLCTRVGYELYEMDPAIRTELLQGLRANPAFGNRRINELANFLLTYVHHSIDDHHENAQGYSKVQEWTALAYVRPEEAVRDLVMQLQERLSINNRGEQLRLASLVDTLAEPLSGFQPLLTYTRGMQSWLYGDIEKAASQLQGVVDEKSSVPILDMKLPVPSIVLQRMKVPATTTIDTPGANIGRDRDVEFVRMRKGDLKAVPVFVQALDNQWLPCSLLYQAIAVGGVTPTIEQELTRLVRSEYIRVLLNSQQIIVNRSYLYNNPAISQDYLHRNTPAYTAFRDFLEEGIIIPFLTSEESPVESFGDIAGGDAFARWVELCQEVRTHCIRLSWDSQQNEKLTNDLLARRFHQFVLGLATGDIDVYLQDLGLDPSVKDSFRKVLVQMGQLCLDLSGQGSRVTRSILYREFVTSGDNPAERRYDSRKPFSAEIKQLLDLSYNVNIADALDGYLITPIDSLPRTALQEWQLSYHSLSTSGKELLRLLQNVTFDLQPQPILNVPSMDLLELPDVREIRATEEWAKYIESLENLLKNPANFAIGGVEKVYKSYAALAEQITKRISTHPGKGSLLTTWSPGIELTFNIAGAHLSYRWTQQGPQWRLQGKLPDLVEGDEALVIGNLAIRDMTEEKPQQDLSTAIDFMRFRMPNVQEEWKYIEAEIRRLPGFQEITMEVEIVDPTISYKEPLDSI